MTAKLFYDSEFTGLHQATTLISLALCSEELDGPEFYAEFSDFAGDQCDNWIRENVLAHTHWISAGTVEPIDAVEGSLTLCYGNRAYVTGRLLAWLEQFGQVEIWADCLAYDWVLFCQLFGGALNLPQRIFWMPFDITTLFRLRGMDPETDREGFAELPDESGEFGGRHNALRDARVARACYERLTVGTCRGDGAEASSVS